MLGKATTANTKITIVDDDDDEISLDSQIELAKANLERLLV